jgi:hypothetical protein
MDLRWRAVISDESSSSSSSSIEREDGGQRADGDWNAAGNMVV